MIDFGVGLGGFSDLESGLNLVPGSFDAPAAGDGSFRITPSVTFGDQFSEVGQLLIDATVQNDLQRRAVDDAILRTQQTAMGVSPMFFLDSGMPAAGPAGDMNVTGFNVPSAIESGLALLTSLAQAGIVRGDVGMALAPQTGVAGGAAAEGAAQLLGMLTSSGGTAKGCTPLVDAPQLFRMNQGSGPRLPSRIQVRGPDGCVFVLANLGRATRGSREASVMRRLARDNGFTLGRRGASRSTRRRRNPR